MSQYSISFYLHYLARWPEYQQVAESPNGDIMGYGKSPSHTLLEIYAAYKALSYAMIKSNDLIVEFQSCLV